MSYQTGTDDESPIVLVHGLGVSSRYMTPLACELARNFPVVVPDLPGFGRSDKPKHVPDVKQLAEYLEGWLRTVNIRPTLFIGNSMGCQILVELAHIDREIVRGLVFLGPTMDQFAPTRLSHVGRLLLDQFAEPPTLVPLQAYDYLSNGPLRTIKTFLHAAKHDMLQRTSAVTAPCLILRGEKDTIVSQPWVEALARVMPTAHLEVISNAGHALNYNAAPTIAPMIAKFWRAHGLGV